MSEEKKGFFAKLKSALTKTRYQFKGSMNRLFSSNREVDDDFFEELEEILIMSDVGVTTTEYLLKRIREEMMEAGYHKPEEVLELLKKDIKEILLSQAPTYRFLNEQSVITMIGVNGAGKTTSIGKLAMQFKEMGKKVVLAAADTFRAAASDQLNVWAERSGALIVNGIEGSDPSAVLFDAIQSAKAKKADILICDTAGRLQNKKNLMDELSKMNRVLDRELPGIYRENLLVLDATTGQNAMSQAIEFNAAMPIDGIILTKMDGTAKGGMVVAIAGELKLPVKYIGVGEHIEDLQKFDADLFTEALFAEREE